MSKLTFDPTVTEYLKQCLTHGMKEAKLKNKIALVSNFPLECLNFLEMEYPRNTFNRLDLLSAGATQKKSTERKIANSIDEQEFKWYLLEEYLMVEDNLDSSPADFIHIPNPLIKKNQLICLDKELVQEFKPEDSQVKANHYFSYLFANFQSSQNLIYCETNTNNIEKVATLPSPIINNADILTFAAFGDTLGIHLCLNGIKRCTLQPSDLYPASEDDYSYLIQWQILVIEKKHSGLLLKEDENSLASAQARELLRSIYMFDQFKTFKCYSDPYNHSSRELQDVSQLYVVESLIKKIDTLNSTIEKNDNYSFLTDMFVTAPTGSGKSLLFTLPAIYASQNYNNLTIIIQPLKALINDQFQKVKKKYSKTCELTGDLPYSERIRRIDDIKSHKVDIVFMTPEFFNNAGIINDILVNRNLSLLVVDEAHTVSAWGKTFRVEYWNLKNSIKKYRKKHAFIIYATTATAVLKGVEGTIDQTKTILGMRIDESKDLVFGCPKKNNIRFIIRKPDPATGHSDNLEDARIQTFVQDFINQHSEPSEANLKCLIFTPYKRHSESIAKYYNQPHYMKVYHSEIDSRTKKELAQWFKEGSNLGLRALCSTKAFGMGVDISDIRQVWHFAPPLNISDYIQEVGRAGRDDSLCEANILYLNDNDFRFVNTLNSLSRITQYTLRSILRAIYDRYDAAQNKGFFISVNDFQGFFPNTKERDVSNKVLTALNYIEQDLNRASQYPIIYINPNAQNRLLYLSVSKSVVHEFKREFKAYVYEHYVQGFNSSTQDIFCLDIVKIWEDKFPDTSFFKFKSEFPEVQSRKLCNDTRSFYWVQKVSISKKNRPVKVDDIKLMLTKISAVFKVINEQFRQSPSGSRVLKTELHKAILPVLQNQFPDMEFKANNISPFLAYFEKIEEDGTGDLRCLVSYGDYYQLNDYDKIKVLGFAEGCIKLERKCYGSLYDESGIYLKQCEFIRVVDHPKKMYGLQLASYLGFVDLKFDGGEDKAIYIVVAAPQKLKNLVEKRNYTSPSLKQFNDTIAVSQRRMKTFIENFETDNERWTYVEDYFLGRLD